MLLGVRSADAQDLMLGGRSVRLYVPYGRTGSAIGCAGWERAAAPDHCGLLNPFSERRPAARPRRGSLPRAG
jgi:hypothetical protein